MPSIVLLHGAATTARVWTRVIEELDGLGWTDVLALERPCTGSLDTELAALAPDVRDSLVVGQSGGATLALAFAASDLPLRGAICHEPAVGSLVPGLLAPFGDAFARGGVAEFGAALYGSSWTAVFAGADPAAVARDLPMFRGFEPTGVRGGQGPVLVTVGQNSPPVRHQAAGALRERFGHRVEVIPGAGHFVAWDAAPAFARMIAREADRSTRAEASDAAVSPQRGMVREPESRPASTM